MGKKKDPQASAVYEWEAQWIHWNNQGLSMRGIRLWTEWAAAQYIVPVPSVRPANKLQRKADRSFCSYTHRRLVFMPQHQNIAVVLHEMAHHIADILIGDNTHDHGKDWLGIFLWLLRKAGIAPETALTASATAAGLKFSNLKSVSPNKLNPAWVVKNKAFKHKKKARR